MDTDAAKTDIRKRGNRGKMNPIMQMLNAIDECTSDGCWARIFLKNGEVLEARSEGLTWVGDYEGLIEDEPGINVMLRSGKLFDIAGTDIDRFEILQN